MLSNIQNQSVHFESGHKSTPLSSIPEKDDDMDQGREIVMDDGDREIILDKMDDDNVSIRLELSLDIIPAPSGLFTFSSPTDSFGSPWAENFKLNPEAAQLIVYSPPLLSPTLSLEEPSGPKSPIINPLTSPLDFAMPARRPEASLSPTMKVPPKDEDQEMI